MLLNSLTVLLASGRSHADDQRWTDAYEAYTKATETLPRYFLVWLERGKLNAKLGRWKSAAKDFAKAVSSGGPVGQADLSGVPQLLFYAAESTAYVQLCDKLRLSDKDHTRCVAAGLRLAA